MYITLVKRILQFVPERLKHLKLNQHDLLTGNNRVGSLEVRDTLAISACVQCLSGFISTCMLGFTWLTVTVSWQPTPANIPQARVCPLHAICHQLSLLRIWIACFLLGPIVWRLYQLWNSTQTTLTLAVHLNHCPCHRHQDGKDLPVCAKRKIKLLSGYRERIVYKVGDITRIKTICVVSPPLLNLLLTVAAWWGVVEESCDTHAVLTWY